MRKVTSYWKIQCLIGRLRRNQIIQTMSNRVKSLPYLEIGCGPCPKLEFVNLDYRWRPGVDVVWDINKTLPFEEHRFNGIFTEHCLEHLTLPALGKVLNEFHRILSPSGVLRIVVPDLEKYIRENSKRYQGGSETCDKQLGTAAAINRVFYSGYENMIRSHWTNDGHNFMHDFESMSEMLHASGFKTTNRCSFRQGKLPALLVDRSHYSWESLYIEACK